MRFLNIVPVKTKAARDAVLPLRLRHQRDQVRIDVESTVGGPSQVEFEYEAAMATPYIIQLVATYLRNVELGGVVVDCMLDPGVDQARELFELPIVGPNEVGIAAARELGDRVGLLCNENAAASVAGRSNRVHGRDAITKLIVSPVNSPELRSGSQRIGEHLVELTRTAHREEHLNVVVLGCTIMSLYVPAIRSQIDVPLVDPMDVALATLIAGETPPGEPAVSSIERFESQWRLVDSPDMTGDPSGTGGSGGHR